MIESGLRSERTVEKYCTRSLTIREDASANNTDGFKTREYVGCVRV